LLQKYKFSRNKSQKLILNVSAYINPIALRYVDGDLACKRVTVSGWGRPYDG
jgi:hypothetical protein